MDMVPAWVNGSLQPVEKLEVHRRGLRHKAVSVFVLCGDKVLIQQRAHDKYHTPGLWANTCCTHPHWNEDPAACAERRLAEELGITGLSPVFRHRAEYSADVGGGLHEHELVEIFVAEAPDDLVVRPDPAEVAAVRWVAIPELIAEVNRRPEQFTPWLRIYLENHLEKIFGPGMRPGASPG